MRRQIRSLPPLRWRDQRIAELTAERDAARAERDAARTEAARWAAQAQEHVPSFSRSLEQWRRLARVRVEGTPAPPRFGLNEKLLSKRLAQGHGVPVPTLLEVWDDLADVDLARMPDEFVLKSAGGAGSHGVFPLRRVGDRFSLISTPHVLTADEVVGRLAAKVDARKARPPFFAEEFLRDEATGELPHDIKVYAFYGEIGQVRVRRVDDHADKQAMADRYVDAAGKDLGAVRLDRQIDASIPVPERLEEVVAASRRLSLATRLPFVRVDFYETSDGIRFGEFTLHPGGHHRYTPEHDRRLGEMWESAQARLDADVAAGVPYAHDFGTEQAPSS